MGSAADEVVTVGHLGFRVPPIADGEHHRDPNTNPDPELDMALTFTLALTLTPTLSLTLTVTPALTLTLTLTLTRQLVGFDEEGGDPRDRCRLG